MSAPISDWDPIGEQGITDPVGLHNEMRHRCPVAYSDQFGGFWSLFRHEDIVHVARETDTFISTPTFMVPKLDIGVPWVPLQSDPPLHQLYRKIINPFFRGTRLAQFEPRLREYTNTFIDQFIERGEVDVAAELNIPLPATALCLLMGLPEERWSDLNRWTVTLVAAGDRGDMDAMTAVYQELFAFVDDWVDRRRSEPGEDLIGSMLTAEIDGRPLTQQEIQGMFVLLLTAGHETTSNTLSSTMRYLSENPDARELLRAEPELMPTAVTEFIRFCAPVQAQARTAARDVEIGGRTIRKGEHIALMFASGSRDEDVFEDPGSCVLDRDSRKHLSFGTGIHRCIGEHLAKLEIQVVLTEFLSRIDDFEVCGETDPANWPAIGYHSLPIKFTKRTG